MLPASRSRLVALCAIAADNAGTVPPEGLPLSVTIPAASLCRLHAARLAGGLADPDLAQVARLAEACAEYLENALAVIHERERAAKGAA